MKIILEKKDGNIQVEVYEKNPDLKIEQNIPLNNIINRLSRKSNIEIKRERSFTFNRPMKAKIYHRRKREGD